MLDYAMIGLKRWPDQGNKDTVAFLQSCSRLSELTALVHTLSRHVQTSPSLSPLLPHNPLQLRLLRLPPLTLVLLRSRKNWLT